MALHHPWDVLHVICRKSSSCPDESQLLQRLAERKRYLVTFIPGSLVYSELGPLERIRSIEERNSIGEHDGIGIGLLL